MISQDRLSAGSVGVRHGRIVHVGAIDDDLTAGTELTLRDDEVLLPGLVDIHVHINAPGRSAWEGFETGSSAACAGGITTLIDMPLNSLPPTVDARALAIKQETATSQTFVDVGFWGGAIPGNVPDLRSLHDAGVFGLKVFLADSGVEEFPFVNAEQLSLAMDEMATWDGLLVVHAEDQEVLDRAPAPDGRSYQRFLESRPDEAEVIAVSRVIEFARRTGGRVHILHVSSAEALPIIAHAKADGVAVTAESGPHYLTISADEIPDGATEFKCCPPIRNAANQDLLWEALRVGTIDMIASDHSPSTTDLKCLDSGDFGAAWGGIASLQLGLPVIWTEARRRGFGLTDVVRWMATRPAEIARLPSKGRISVGAAADLAVFAPDESFVVDPGQLHHRNPVTPYTGRRLDGVVRQTLLAGVPVDLSAAPRGQLLSAADGRAAPGGGVSPWSAH